MSFTQDVKRASKFDRLLIVPKKKEILESFGKLWKTSETTFLVM